MSLVDVLPVDPVMPTTRQAPPPSSSSQRRDRPASAASGSGLASTLDPPRAVAARSACSGVTTTPHAPASIARSANVPPSSCSPGRPKNRSPGPACRESTIARAGASDGPGACASPATIRAPQAAAISSGSSSIKIYAASLPRLGATATRAAPRAPPRNRRMGSSGPAGQAPAPARVPCPRSRRGRQPVRAPSPARSRRAGSARPPGTTQPRLRLPGPARRRA